MRNFAHTGKRYPLRIMTKFYTWVDIHDLITYATFGDDRLIKGFGRGKGSKISFPNDLHCRPYNTLALPCECVICSYFSSLLFIQSSIVVLCPPRLLVPSILPSKMVRRRESPLSTCPSQFFCLCRILFIKSTHHIRNFLIGSVCWPQV